MNRTKTPKLGIHMKTMLTNNRLARKNVKGETEQVRSTHRLLMVPADKHSFKTSSETAFLSTRN